MAELMTLEEVANYLRVTEKTIYRLLDKRAIPATRVSHLWRFDKTYIDNWLNQSSIGVDARILVVDDDDTICSLFKDTLESEGYKVTTGLIDDLIKLSRVTRNDINYDKVNFSDLAQKVVEELTKADPTRKVKVSITPGVIAYGDRNLLRIVLDNLIGNAWKFSSKTAEPRIEIGTIELKGKLTYFIRDNGIGFNMAYADKLFKPFQRLHKASEFPGTGIGLATVQRIIRRHGGEVWVESKVGEGATFFFTLG